MNLETEHFKRVGVKMNTRKTQFMITKNKQLPTKNCEEAYNRRITGQGPSYDERMAEMTVFPRCGEDIQTGCLQEHLRDLHGIRLNNKLEPPTKPKTYTVTTRFSTFPDKNANLNPTIYMH